MSAETYKDKEAVPCPYRCSGGFTYTYEGAPDGMAIPCEHCNPTGKKPDEEEGPRCGGSGVIEIGPRPVREECPGCPDCKPADEEGHVCDQARPCEPNDHICKNYRPERFSADEEETDLWPVLYVESPLGGPQVKVFRHPEALLKGREHQTYYPESAPNVLSPEEAAKVAHHLPPDHELWERLFDYADTPEGEAR